MHLKVFGYMFRPHCGHLQANIYRLRAFNVSTIWDPVVASVKMIASQARTIFQYKNTRIKVLKYCANIYFNKQCLAKRGCTLWDPIFYAHWSYLICICWPEDGRNVVETCSQKILNELALTFVYLIILLLCLTWNTGCFTTLGHNCRRWFPRSLWWKKFI